MKYILTSLFIWSFATLSFAETITWETSKANALAKANAEGKLILLLAGRHTCGNCNYMINTVCESTDPNIKGIIEQSFIPWFCDIDASTEWWTYADGLGSFYLPLICCIDPDNINEYIDRTTGTYPPEEFYARLNDIVGSFCDLNSDGKVDIMDIMMVAAHWNSLTGDLIYIATCDLDHDGDIDIIDIMKVAAQWGWTA